jgi:hypothetical protein
MKPETTAMFDLNSRNYNEINEIPFQIQNQIGILHRASLKRQITLHTSEAVFFYGIYVISQQTHIIGI